MENTKLQYDLIVDSDLSLQEAYGVWQRKQTMGRHTWELLGQNAELRNVDGLRERNVRVNGHVDGLEGTGYFLLHSE